jgi:hypothetical protein
VLEYRRKLASLITGTDRCVCARSPAMLLPLYLLRYDHSCLSLSLAILSLV